MCTRLSASGCCVKVCKSMFGINMSDINLYHLKTSVSFDPPGYSASQKIKLHLLYYKTQRPRIEEMAKHRYRLLALQAGWASSHMLDNPIRINLYT
jgi:hypothetical protein